MSKFGDLDPIELQMGKRVSMMDEKELFDYFEKWYEGLFQVKLPQDRAREMSMFRRLKKVYGGEAGTLIKWVFYRYEGEWVTRKGKTVRVKTNWWGAREKAWHDEMLDEARAEIQKERKARKPVVKKESEEVSEKPTVKKKTGFKTAEDFLR